MTKHFLLTNESENNRVETIVPPQRYPRRILLSATGLSPQIVTETLYSLTVVQQPPFIPTEVHLVTTAAGHQHAELTLLHPSQGRFHRFLSDYGLNADIRFDSSHIHVITDAQGQPLTDIRDAGQNTRAADDIVALVRRLTADPDSALHISIAGGRKTMGFYAGYALTLFGRPQDRLSHVLVAPPFENHHLFFYPPPVPEVLFGHDNQPINTADAEITLAEIPFVSLRHGLPTDLLDGAGSYSEAVRAASRSFAAPNLLIDIPRQLVVCGEREIRLPPQLFTFYAWMAQRRKTIAMHGGHVRYTDDIADEFLRLYRVVVGDMAHDYEMVRAMYAEGMPKEFFEEKKSRINGKLRHQLGAGAAPYLIVASGKRPRQRFGLGLSAEAIEINQDIMVSE